VAEKTCTRKPLNLEARGQASAPGRFQDRPLSGRAERPAATCSCKPHKPSPYDRCATTLSWEPHCDRTRVAASGAGGAVARGAARKRPAAPRRRGLHKARCLERRVPGGPHARRCLRSRPLRPPCGSNRGPTRRDGSRATRQRSRLGTLSPSRRAVDAPTWRSSRWAGFVGPGVTAYLAAHFACLLRQSRNSWNSSGLAAGGLPASPCCCFIKSLNFARSSGSCAFLSSHS
jgi:hypothetical protein